MNILEFSYNFTFEYQNPLIFADNFKLTYEWCVLRINSLKTIEKTYCNKTPFNQPSVAFDVALYNQSRWYYLNFDTCTGTVIKFNKQKIKIPGLNIINQNCKPYVSCIIFDFDLQIMLTMLNTKNNITIIEKEIFPDKCKIILNNEFYIECGNSIFKYKGNNHKTFKIHIDKLKHEYQQFEKQVMNMYSILNLKLLYKTHESIAPKTWYKAKRQNQQKEWPKIVSQGGIEFPKNSGIFYDKTNLGLARRIDDNDEKFIPKIYKTNHLKNEDSLLYKYINNISIPENIFPPHIKSKEIKILTNQQLKYAVEIDYNNNILEIPKYQLYYSFEKYFIKNIINESFNYIDNIQAQILNKDNKRDFIINYKNEIIKNKGYKLKNIISLPWYYKQIVHDYNKLGRLKYGPLMDLTHIGIVNPNSTDTITFPYKDKELLISTCLETHRLMTFKYQANVILKTMV